jgi:hypothetical protein
MWYHWLNDNKIHVLKSILIRAQVEMPNICTFEIFFFLTMNEKQQYYGHENMS